MKGCSTLQQFLIFLNSIHEHSKAQTDVIYLDFAKAFDRVPHNELLLKLWRIGITGDLWWWFKSYLSYRQQCVCLKGSFSTFFPVLSGVPQGSILGPLLFLIYINNLFSTVHASNALSFADDTKCYKLILELRDSAQLQRDLDSMAEIGICSLIPTNLFTYPSIQISYLLLCRHLHNSNQQFTLQPWHHYINSFFMERSLPPYNSQGLRTLSLLRRTFSHSIDTSTKKVLYLALVRSQLLYCSPIWHSNLICDITALERIQRLATKYILNDHPITKLVFSTSICYH